MSAVRSVTWCNRGQDQVQSCLPWGLCSCRSLCHNLDIGMLWLSMEAGSKSVWELLHRHIQTEPVQDGAGSQAVSSTCLCTSVLVSQHGQAPVIYHDDCCSSLAESTRSQISGHLKSCLGLFRAEPSIQQVVICSLNVLWGDDLAFFAWRQQGLAILQNCLQSTGRLLTTSSTDGSKGSSSSLGRQDHFAAQHARLAASPGPSEPAGR